MLGAGSVDDVSSGERMVFTHATSGRRVAASFGVVPAGTTFSAAMMGASELGALDGLLAPADWVAGGWDFTTNLVGGEVLLSFDIGAGLHEEDLAVWHLADGAWAPYAPGMMGYDAGTGVVTFTAGSFSGYAVVVPEPGSAAGAVLGVLGVGVARRRRRR